jgi:hypothetical protein
MDQHHQVNLTKKVALTVAGKVLSILNGYYERCRILPGQSKDFSRASVHPLLVTDRMHDLSHFHRITRGNFLKKNRQPISRNAAEILKR